jgi:hypothetical protein
MTLSSLNVSQIACRRVQPWGLHYCPKILTYISLSSLPALPSGNQTNL